MSSQNDVVAKAAQELGYTNAGFNGNGHIVWVHPNGARYVSAATPSDHRGCRNAISHLEQLAGAKVARPNHRRSRKSFAVTADIEVEASRRRHAETFDAVADERDRAKQAEAQRQADAEATAASERRRREIEELMRP